MKSLAATLLFSLSLFADSKELVRTAETDLLDLFSAQDRLAPSFQNGKFISIRFETSEGDLPNIFLFDKAGKQSASHRLAPPETTSIRLHGASVGASGLLAVVGRAIDTHGRFATFLAVVSPGKSQPSYFPLNPYDSDRVAVGQDDSIWLTTTRLDEAGGESSRHADYKVLRHFSKDGKLLGEFVPRSALQGFLPASGNGGTDVTALLQSGNGVSAYFGGSQQLVETSGGKIGKQCNAQLPQQGGELPLTFGGLAGRADGTILAHFEYLTAGTGLFTLDCAAGKWQPLRTFAATDPNRITQLVGTDGTQVVYRTPASPTGVLWADL